MDVAVLFFLVDDLRGKIISEISSYYKKWIPGLQSFILWVKEF